MTKKRRKRLLLGVGVPLGVIVVALLVLWLFLGSVAAAGLVQGVRTVGEVPCTVDSVGVHLVRGAVTIDELAIGNPPDFPEADRARALANGTH